MGTQFKTGSYKYLGDSTTYTHGTEHKALGARGPLDVWLLNSGSFVLSAADGTTDVEVRTLSGTVFSLSAVFEGWDLAIALSSTDVSQYSNLAITLVNHSTHNIESASVEFSPNSVNWATDWDTTTFASLTSSGVRSLQIAGNSRNYVRIRAISSGSLTDGAGTGPTGSLMTYLHANVG